MSQQVSLKLFLDNHIFDGMTDKQIKIMVAAIRIFAEKGYANTSTKEIAKAADVAEGNIFSKFDNKRGLLNAIVNPVIATLFPETLSQFSDAKIANHSTRLHDFIGAMVADRINFVTENADVMKIFIAEMAYNHQLRDAFRHQFQTTTAFYTDAITRNLNLLKATQQMVDWRNPEIMRMIWSLVGGLIISYLFFNQPITDHDISHAVDGLTKALSR
ncbi:TetR/AcrR family transcriptional regulator [Lentilactobacillus parafarraginis]|uniref:TetR/AcrR family transcriptional regulator n=1 Tax=Lentilactobacillus parafarraginis TaxID=390842 RepID=A0A5R9CW04_9LACO|nr:TetR/AcrR family transcriptional regulator [Lentilactobacillus parafarraginis]TLQ19163.1 TetR/AcrR family transcriptional regulator [Lentilactobacillus parafarraginis]